MKKPWLDELRYMVKELDKRLQRGEILKDTPFAHSVVALIKLVGVDRHPAVDPNPEILRKLAESAIAPDMHLAFECSTDEQAFKRVLSSLRIILDHLERSSKEVIAT
jgi:hypothetical protein